MRKRVRQTRTSQTAVSRSLAPLQMRMKGGGRLSSLLSFLNSKLFGSWEVEGLPRIGGPLARLKGEIQDALIFVSVILWELGCIIHIQKQRYGAVTSFFLLFPSLTSLDFLVKLFTNSNPVA